MADTATTTELRRFRNVVNGQPCDSTTGRWLASTNPYTGEDWAEVPRCGPEDADAAVEAAHAAFTRGPWATDDRLRPRQAAPAPRRADRPGRREARGDRDPRQRQALRRDVGAAPLRPGVVPLLRRARRQDRGRGAADRQGGDVRLHQARAARRRGRDHAVELSPAAPLLEARPGARRRQHRRHQALRVHLLLDARADGAGEGGGLPRRRPQHRHRLRRRGRPDARRAPEGRQDRLHRRRRHRAPRSTPRPPAASST